MADETLLKGQIALLQIPDPYTDIINSLYYFDIITEHSVQLQNQITDNYLENNTAVQDHIAQNPVVITLRGGRAQGLNLNLPNYAKEKQLLAEAMYQAEKMGKSDLNQYWGLKHFDAGRINDKFDKLAKITVLLPQVDNITQIAKNIYDYTEASILKYQSIWKNYSDKNNPQSTINNNSAKEIPNRLENMYAMLSAKRANNAPLVVHTPYKTFDDMYIQSLTLRQSNQNYVTDIELTLKQLRFADVQLGEVNEAVRARYNAAERAKLEDNGKAQGTQTELKKMSDKNLGTTYGTGFKR